MARRLLLVVLALALPALALPPSSFAHAYLIRSAPEAGARLQSAPRELKLFFSEPFVAGSERVAVRFADGEKLELAAPTRRRTTVLQVLPPVQSRIAIVNWRVVAEDGHISTGEFAFAAGAAGELPELTSTTTTGASAADVVLSWLFFIGLAVALGGLVSERFIWRPGTIGSALVRAPAAAGTVLAALAAVAALATLDSGLSGRPAKLVASEVALLVVALAVMRAARSLALLPLLGTAIVSAERGHSGSSGYWWAVPADATHLAAAAVWVGALAHLVLVARRLGRAELRAHLPDGASRYAQVALVSVAVTVVGGIGTALAQFGSLDELVDTGYGQALLVKGALLGLALASAGLARTFALPGPGFLERRRSRELAAVAVALLVFAALLGPDLTHAAAAALFVASLLLLALLVLRRGRWNGTRFAAVTVAGFLALFGTGAMAAFAQARDVRPPEGEPWAAAVQIGLAAAALWLLVVLSLRPLLRTGEGSVPLLRRLTGAETLLLAGVLAAAAVLVNVAPPRGQAANFEALGPPPLRGPAIRLGNFVGQLAVGVAATERELRFQIIKPGGVGPAGADIAVEARQPGKFSADLYPRPCGDGCFTIRFSLPTGMTTISARVSAPGWAGGSTTFVLPWPPGREQPQLLARVAKTMASIPRLRVTELVTSGPGTNSRPLGAVLSGRRLLESEGYGAGGVDVRVLGRKQGLTEVAFALPPSNLWYRMWIDDRFRVQRQVLVNSGHRITRTFAYGSS